MKYELGSMNNENKNKTDKTIISIWHSSGKGKTGTLREIAQNLLSLYPNYKPILPIPAIVNQQHNFRLIIEINGKIIGIESKGDPNTNLEKRLEYLASTYSCDKFFALLEQEARQLKQ